jgi:cytochrome P450
LRLSNGLLARWLASSGEGLEGRSRKFAALIANRYRTRAYHARVNLFTPEALANPYPLYHRMRAEQPVYRLDAIGAWAITRYADVVQALRHPLLSSERASVFVDELPPEAREAMRPVGRSLAMWMLFSDPPNHTRLRALTTRAFSPRVVESMRARVETIVAELIDGKRASGRMDIIRDLAYPLPAIVIAEILGVAASDREAFKRWSDDLGTYLAGGRILVERAERARRSWEELDAYLRDLVARRRASPQSDLLSSLIAAEEAESRLSEEELLSTCVMILFGGHETTTNLIGNGTLALLQHPDRLEWLRSDPSRLKTAIEELLRFDSPVQYVSRVAKEDLEIGGSRVVKGERVLALIGAANRDPAQFSDPDSLVLTRADNRHLAFGLGIHFCIGAALARVEAELAFGALLRLPGLALSTPAPKFLPNLGFRGLESLPVQFLA